MVRPASESRSPCELTKRVRADLDLGRGLDQAPHCELRRIQCGAADAKGLRCGEGVVAEVVPERQRVGLDVVLTGKGRGAVVALVRLDRPVG